ncbi:MAG: clostripain-related cysteine peptidase [Atopobiaceae bacterium]
MTSRHPAAQRFLAVLLSGALIFSGGALAACDDEDISTSSASGIAGTDLSLAGLRDHYVDTDSAKSATVLVYMVGSDLESEYGAASADIQEMVDAECGKNVNIVVETGGASSWEFSDEADGTLRQRWHITGDGAELLGDTGSGSVLDENEVTDFISFATDAYPADRYLMVFWDHGGGTVGGFGSDENYPDDKPLSLADLRQALLDSGQKFDIVGFDACLMGTVETAYALEPCADYLIASEEYEPGEGWSWTGFLRELEDNPSTSSVELGKRAIDDYYAVYKDEDYTDVTLSLVDLREVPNVYESMSSFLASAESAIASDNSRFKELSQARSRATSFADGQIDQVDLIDLITRTDFDGKDSLEAAVRSCVKYRSATSIDGANGLALYFPYDEVSSYEGMRSTLTEISYTKPTEFYDYFLSIMGSSSSEGTGTGSILSSIQSAISSTAGTDEAASSASGGDFASSSSQDSSWFSDVSESFSYDELPSALELAETSAGYIVEMDDTLWDALADFQVSVMQRNPKNEAEYIYLGSDNVWDTDADDNIIVDFDGTWTAIDGHIVSFFGDTPTALADGTYSFTGTIPAILNGEERIDIIVYWPPEDQSIGYVQGWRSHEQTQSHVFGHGLSSFSTGDEIVPIFDVYDEEGNWLRTMAGDAITISDPDSIEVTYESSGDEPTYFWGMLTTVYGDAIDTEALVIEQ